MMAKSTNIHRITTASISAVGVNDGFGRPFAIFSYGDEIENITIFLTPEELARLLGEAKVAVDQLLGCGALPSEAEVAAS